MDLETSLGEVEIEDKPLIYTEKDVEERLLHHGLPPKEAHALVALAPENIDEIVSKGIRRGTPGLPLPFDSARYNEVAINVANQRDAFFSKLLRRTQLRLIEGTEREAVVLAPLVLLQAPPGRDSYVEYAESQKNGGGNRWQIKVPGFAMGADQLISISGTFIVRATAGQTKLVSWALAATVREAITLYDGAPVKQVSLVRAKRNATRTIEVLQPSRATMTWLLEKPSLRRDDLDLDLRGDASVEPVCGVRAYEATSDIALGLNVQWPGFSIEQMVRAKLSHTIELKFGLQPGSKYSGTVRIVPHSVVWL